MQVQASSLFEAAAQAVAAFREQGWAAEALKPNATLRVEVHVPPVVHDVPLKAVKQWRRSPSASPKRRLSRPMQPAAECECGSMTEGDRIVAGGVQSRPQVARVAVNFQKVPEAGQKKREGRPPIESGTV